MTWSSLPSGVQANVRKTNVIAQAHRSEQEYAYNSLGFLFSKDVWIYSYFDSEDYDDAPAAKPKTRKFDDDLDYQPAPGSPSYKAEEKAAEDDDEDDEDDPLEQFMKANNDQAKKDLESIGKKKDTKQEK
mgnify:FL=1